jgi:hypothetical protein
LAGTEAWKAHAQVLKEILDHHIKEEEREIFEELGEHFSEDQRAAMGADFVARKEQLLLAAGRSKAPCAHRLARSRCVVPGLYVH